MSDQVSGDAGQTLAAAPCSAFAREVCTLLADDSLQYAPMADALCKE
ncbi:MAG: hypothetical protein V4563_17455 [Pseudomonadota bacterium]